MSFPTSPNDPVFFLHHCYLDLLWERWKRQHPTSAPYLPQNGVPGMDQEATLVFHATGSTAPWEKTWTVNEVITTEALDYTYGVFTSPPPTCLPQPPVCRPTPGPVVDLIADEVTI